MPDRIDAPMDSMQASRLNPPQHPAFVDPRRPKLSKGQNSMLSGRNPRHRDLGWGVFFSHTENKSPQADFLPPWGPARAIGRGGGAQAGMPNLIR